MSGDVTEETQAEVETTETQEQAPEVEEAAQEEVEAKTEDGEEAAEEEAPEGEEQPEPAKPEDQGRHKRAGGYQRRLARLERELQQRDEYIQSLVAQRPAANAVKQPEMTEAQKAEAYVDNLVAQRLAAREQQAEQARAQAEFQRRIAETQAKHADFDDAIEAVEHIPVPRHVQDTLLTSEHGPEIMYALAKSPAELARISALPPLVAAREIGRLEAKLASATAAPPKPKAAIRPPAPPTTVGGASKPTRSIEDLPISEYKRAFRSKAR